MNGKKKAIGIAVCILLTTAALSGAAGKMMKETDVALLTTTVALPGAKGTIPQDCPPCMVSYWKLDEISGVITNDSYGGNDGGILTDGDGNDPEWETGQVDNALHFAGDAPDMVIIGDDPSFHFGTGDFALEAWIKYEGPTSGSVEYPAIMSKRPGPPGSDPIEGFCLCLSYWQGGIPGTLLLRIEDTNYVPCSTRVDDGDWHHVVVQRCLNQVQFYVDGDLDATATSTKDATTSAALSLGLDWSSSHDTEWEGLLDEVAVYDCCLSSGTIKCHYECGLTGEGYCAGTVHNIDTDKWYHWIQDAIDDPETNNNPGDHDTIEVYDPNLSTHPTGTYVENIYVNKSLTLRASDGAHPVIDGGGSGWVVTIEGAPDVEVSGFTIQKGSRGVFIWTGADRAIIKDNTIIDNSNSGIFFGSNYHLIENNKIAFNKYGIIAGCSQNIDCKILKNTIKDNTYGMRLLAISGFTITNNRIENNNWGIHFTDGCGGSCYDNHVIKNQIYFNANYGIGLSGSSNNNHIKGNPIMGNEYGVEIGGNSNENEIKGNDIAGNEYGVEIRGNSNENEIKGNYIMGNEYGVDIRGNSYKNEIRSNHIIDNEYGIRITDSTVIDNVIYNNYFNNTHNAHDEGTNYWNIDKVDVDNGEDYNYIGGTWFGGNYWSDYTGADDGSGVYPHDAVDGLGDTQVPYNCSGGIQNGGDDLPLVGSKEPPCVKITKKAIDPTTGDLVDSIEVPVGTKIDFVITVCNCGTSDLGAIEVVDYFPSNLEYVDSEASEPANESISGNQVTWEFSSLTLHPGDCFKIRVEAQVTSEGDDENCVEVHAESQEGSISDEDCVAVTGAKSGICLGSTLLTGILALGVIALNRKKNR